ncbi:MAG: protein-export chaperone SecB [Allgaiera sp.]|jgi:preprotein translocase subunit SecB|nr:protein-export chaperone SecB [Allgaiera sp.]
MAENGEDIMQAEEPQVRLQILAQYIRDMSFENVVAQKGFDGGEITPDIEVQVSLDGRQRPIEHQYEVVMKFQITSKNQTDQANLFLLELEYGGIFLVEGVPEEQLHPFLLIECPRQLFPYVRRIVSDVTGDGGFPQLNLDNIDFVELYRQQMQAQQGTPAQA